MDMGSMVEDVSGKRFSIKEKRKYERLDSEEAYKHHVVH